MVTRVTKRHCYGVAYHFCSFIQLVASCNCEIFHQQNGFWWVCSLTNSGNADRPVVSQMCVTLDVYNRRRRGMLTFSYSIHKKKKALVKAVVVQQHSKSLDKLEKVLCSRKLNFPVRFPLMRQELWHTMVFILGRYCKFYCTSLPASLEGPRAFEEADTCARC